MRGPILSRSKVWGVPLSDIANQQDFEVWLQKQPRKVMVTLVARGGLRALPVVQMVNHAGFRGEPFADVLLPMFRVTAVAWATVKYPAHEAEFAAAVAGFAAAYAADAAAATSTYAYVADAYSNAAAVADGDADNTVAAAFWSALSADATRFEQSTTASEMAGSPLWPDGQPDRLRSLWQEMKNALHTAKQDWEVWTNWYDDRLHGRVRAEEYELAYARIDSDLWDQGPPIVNAEIKKRTKEVEPLRSRE